MGLYATVSDMPGFNAAQKTKLKKAFTLNPKVVYRTTDATVNVSTTLANDDELFVNLEGGKRYLVEGVLHTTVDGTDGLKVAFATATDVTDGRIRYEYSIDNAADQTEVQTDFTSPAPTGLAAAYTMLRMSGHIWPSVDGRFTLQSALVADNNAVTKILKGSWIKFTELPPAA